jgi:hypothetical protein
MERITYREVRCIFLGRNGTYKQAGMYISCTKNGNIVFNPITFKGFPARCYVEIPIEDVDHLIDILQRLKTKHISSLPDYERNTNQNG